jgi:hypothetical protein
MMRLASKTLLILLASACAYSEPSTPADQSAKERAQLAKDQQREFRRCIKEILGHFSDFKSTEAHIKAAEACKQNAPSTPSI